MFNVDSFRPTKIILGYPAQMANGLLSMFSTFPIRLKRKYLCKVTFLESKYHNLTFIRAVKKVHRNHLGTIIMQITNLILG